MAKIKQKINITDAEDSQIRRQWNAERQRWYFSITDVIAVLTESVDARNYWKALKNRLKETNFQLVTDCNQLKMRASDGKSYMVDTAEAETILKIIQIIAPYNIPAFKSWFEHLDVKNSFNTSANLPPSSPIESLSTQKSHIEDFEISTALEPAIDMYENLTDIIVQVMLPGAAIDRVAIITSMNTLTIKAARIQTKDSVEKKYIYRELLWGEFYKKINLPKLIDVDAVEATESRGLITIKLPKININKTRFIKINLL